MKITKRPQPLVFKILGLTFYDACTHFVESGFQTYFSNIYITGGIKIQVNLKFNLGQIFSA